MNVGCPECRSVFRVDPAKVPASGVRARCSVCGGVIAVPGGALPIAVTEARPTPVVQRAVPTAAPVPFPPAVPTVPREPELPAPVMPATSPLVTPAATPVMTPTATPVMPPAAAPVMTPAAMPVMPPAATPVMPPAAPSVATPPVAAPVSPVAAVPASEHRPINPFLQVDPEQRARRLARALVSDLVAYHPQKRDEGLRDGTLRQLFREEIRKSYEEYVEQVGRDLADRSPYFQDALNEILAGGQRLF